MNYIRVASCHPQLLLEQVLLLVLLELRLENYQCDYDTCFYDIHGLLFHMNLFSIIIDAARTIYDLLAVWVYMDGVLFSVDVVVAVLFQLRLGKILLLTLLCAVLFVVFRTDVWTCVVNI